MATSTRFELDYRPSYLAATITGAVIFALYVVTLAPSTAMWDASEYIAAAHVVGLPHPPGNPLFVLIGRVFGILPIAPNVAMRINLLAALTSAISAAMWFLVTERVLVGWLAERWQRIVGGVLAAVIGATAFTVWNQSVVNEKVYTLSLMGLAIVSWLTVRWSDDPDGPQADRILVLIAYLLGLGYTNHMMGFLAAPSVAVAVLVRRPQTLLRWKLLLVMAAMVVLGMTVFATQPIRAMHFPAINEGEPTTWDSFWYNFNRGQYGKPSVFERQAPPSGQIGMWWLYFSWQWLRDMHNRWPLVQQLLAALYLVLGLFGGWVHWKRDRRSFWYFGTFMLTLTLLLIFYLNFKYGYSQPHPEGAETEVRDRDYFFIVSFSAWGVWAALGLTFVWEAVAALFGTVKTRIGKELVSLPPRRNWFFAAPVLAIAFVPLVVNWEAASRAGHTDTRDFAHDLLNSVEPYGILVTVGDNDTFPLWYAQEVEGIRKDVVVANTSLLNTDWYVRQLIRRPVHEYDPARGPAIYRGRQWQKPERSPLHMSLEEADRVPLYFEVSQPQIFRKAGIEATIMPQVLARADLLVLRMISDAFPARPVYFSRTSVGYPDQLGLGDYVMTQGLARKLLPEVPSPSADTLLIGGEGWVDLPRTRALWNTVYEAHESLIERGNWVDRASVGIPYLYISTAAILAEAEQRAGNADAARRLMDMAR
ncbi:MAG: glycosyltransferase family 117 protein, partial [Gemmatimonadaceae bacterium]